MRYFRYSVKAICRHIDRKAGIWTVKWQNISYYSNAESSTTEIFE